MIIATAGHIDHGKTTLVRALTGMDTDRLPEEKARGISIDVGFAHARLRGGATIGFVDVPGHERFVRNMLSGVYAVGHVLLVVAADDGVMPQTREHLHIVSLLGVDSGTVVLTKKDRVDAARVAEVERQARELVQAAGWRDMAVVAVCAPSGEGLDALRQRLADVAAREQHDEPRRGTLARFVVDQVFTVAGSGTVARGTVISGAIAAGQMLTIATSGRAARVRRLQRNGETIDLAEAGQRCALNLAGVERGEVARGDWIVAAEAHQPTARLDVHIRVLPSEAAALKHCAPVHVHIGAADVPARITMRRGEAIAPGGQGVTQLRLARPVHAAHGDRLILRDQSATRTVGGGVVVNPQPPPRRNAWHAAVVAALDGHDAGAALAALLDDADDGVDLAWLAHVYALDLSAVLERLPAGVVLLRTDPPVALSSARAARLQAASVERVTAFHREQRQQPGIELPRLRLDVARSMRDDVFAMLVRTWIPASGLRLKGTIVSLPDHDATDNPRDLLLWQRMRPLLMQAGAAIPSVRELSVLARVPLETLRDLMHRKAVRGELVKLTSERYALPETVEKLAGLARETALERPDGVFTAAQYRDTIGTGRTLAIEILECLDRVGATVRRGDRRHIPPAPSVPAPERREEIRP
jgi:selenocysteine-specific elongation factor